ncbi:MAG TPA: SDR family oxidoreductase [Jatrophihabitans sp.]
MIESKKIVVVGASSGLGRSIGIALAHKGAKVAFLARRKDRLDNAVAEAGNDAIAIACDVTDESSVSGAIEQAAAGLGGIDALLYTTGIGLLSKIENLTVAQWRSCFDTNIIGASLVTSAALAHLRESKGVAIYFSSVSASLTPTWPGLAAYTVSKAALEKMVEAWNAEHGDIGFTRLNVGDCVGGEGDSRTEFANGFDRSLVGTAFPIWTQRKLFAGTMMEVQELMTAVETVMTLGASAHVPVLAVTPRTHEQLFA